MENYKRILECITRAYNFKDLKVHYVNKLSAIDTEERERVLGDLGKVKGKLRDLQLSQTEGKVMLKLQLEKIDRLEGENKRFRED